MIFLTSLLELVFTYVNNQITQKSCNIVIIESMIRNAGSLIFLPLFSIIEATAKTRTIAKTKEILILCK